MRITKLLKRYVLGSLSHGCCDKLYKKESLKNIWFPAETIAEECPTCKTYEELRE